jgi:hypothetical protein
VQSDLGAFAPVLLLPSVIALAQGFGDFNLFQPIQYL